MNRGKAATSLLTACLLLAVSACAGSRSQVVSRTSPVWLAAETIYFLRKADDQPVEMWSRDVADGGERRVATVTDVPDACGPLDYLFRVPGGRLGLALECRQQGRLLAYDPATGAFERLGDLDRRLSGMTLSADLTSGYGVGGDGTTGGGRCSALFAVALPHGAPTPALPELTCAAGASAGSPALTRWGGLVFVATRDKPPADPYDDDKRRWSVHLAGFSGIPFKGIGPTFDGQPALDLSPDETNAIVVGARFGRDRLVLLDLRNGETHEVRSSAGDLYDPSFAPDGRRVAYSDGGDVRIADIGRWVGPPDA